MCVYNKESFKVSPAEKISAVSDNDFQQLWLKVQIRRSKSFLLCTVYRPPSTPLNFLDDLGVSSIRTKDVIKLGDLNCNLLLDNIESRVEL